MPFRVVLVFYSLSIFLLGVYTRAQIDGFKIETYKFAMVSFSALMFFFKMKMDMMRNEKQNNL